MITAASGRAAMRYARIPATVPGSPDPIPQAASTCRRRQADVTDELAKQVFEAVEVLVASFEAAAARCTAHDPSLESSDRHTEGAACHGCLYIAECSCERFNKYLDRALVVPTIGNDPALAFFAVRP